MNELVEVCRYRCCVKTIQASDSFEALMDMAYRSQILLVLTVRGRRIVINFC